MIILLHSSKTMRKTPINKEHVGQPALLEEAIKLNDYLLNLSINEISKKMSVSKKLATQTQELIHHWSDDKVIPIAAADCFLGDIYSGLQSPNWNDKQRKFANNHLYIISGLYGLLKPLDGIRPYRLEMAYKLAPGPYKDLYEYWGDKIAKLIPKSGVIINLSSIEYSKVVTPYFEKGRIISPYFMTVNKLTNEPTFVTVHSKIARGAFANWLIISEADKITDLPNFNMLGYSYSKLLSTPNKPVYICEEFQGLGLSLRLK